MLTAPILASLKISVIATLLCALAGIPLGSLLAMRKFRGKPIIITLLNTMLALPTVVVGLFVYTLICRRSLLGELDLLFSIPAIIMGQVILALPLMTALSHSAIAAVERAARETAITLGADGFRITRTVIWEARFGIMAAVAATFGRLIGEVGVSMMLGGNIEGYTRTMTTAIALETARGEFNLGLQLGAVLLTIALIVNLIMRYFQGRDPS